MGHFSARRPGPFAVIVVRLRRRPRYAVLGHTLEAQGAGLPRSIVTASRYRPRGAVLSPDDLPRAISGETRLADSTALNNQFSAPICCFPCRACPA